jgi:hypothetical protein
MCKRPRERYTPREGRAVGSLIICLFMFLRVHCVLRLGQGNKGTVKMTWVVMLGSFGSPGKKTSK